MRVILNLLHALAGLLGWLTIAVALYLARRLGPWKRPAPRRPAGGPDGEPWCSTGGSAGARRG
jgi:hypothetical protein